MYKIIGSIIILALTACQTSSLEHQAKLEHNNNIATASTAIVSIKHVWRLSQFKEFPTNQLQNTLMDWTVLPSAYADMGCNKMHFQVQADGSGSLKVSGVAATRMMCPDVMPLENSFATTLPKMTAYRVENTDTLVLYNSSGDEMRFSSK